MTEFREDLALDTALVKAGAEGGFEKFLFTAMSLGLANPKEASDRAEWLKSGASPHYREAVIDSVTAAMGETHDP